MPLLAVLQPQWANLLSKEDAFNFADKVGYPVRERFIHCALPFLVLFTAFPCFFTAFHSL